MTWGCSKITFKNGVKTRTLGTKWVAIARTSEISIPIDAARLRDLGNQGFGKVSDELAKNIGVFLFGVVRWSHFMMFIFQASLNTHQISQFRPYSKSLKTLKKQKALKTIQIY